VCFNLRAKLVSGKFMRRLPFDEYLERPVDHWTAGEGWLHFCTSQPPIAGAVTWGAATAATTEGLLACSTASRAVMPPHGALLDGRRTHAIEATSFKLASEYVVRHQRAASRAVTRFAAVRPTGIAGASAEGFFRVVPAPYPVSVFDERGEALAWLGAERLASMIDELEQHAAASAEGATLLPELHRAIEERLADGALAHSAKRLGVSTRSLQRRLRAEGTTFQRELSLVRVRVAQRLMLETDVPLSRIAMDAGFPSPSTLSISFRKHTGMSPSEWREGQTNKK
jgi:AraC-like DNA-binding protein